MYRSHFGLTDKPFRMTPDPGFLFLTAQHREALAGLTYGVLDRKGFVVLTGDAGTGKTTLLSKMMQHLPAYKVQSSIVFNPTLTPSEFLEAAMLDFGIEEIPSSKALRLVKLQNFLLAGDQAGKISILVVDEAHKLQSDLLEEVRLLSNFEHANQKLLQILLLGQTELADLLNRDDLRQFKQRIALRLAIAPLTAGEIEQYIQYRWTIAGGQQHPFATAAIGGIARYSRGIPRLVNALCDNALLLAFGEGSRAVTLAQIGEAARDLDLRDTEPSSAVANPAPAPAAQVPDLKPAPVPEGTPRPGLWARWRARMGSPIVQSPKELS